MRLLLKYFRQRRRQGFRCHESDLAKILKPRWVECCFSTPAISSYSLFVSRSPVHSCTLCSSADWSVSRNLVQMVQTNQNCQTVGVWAHNTFFHDHHDSKSGQSSRRSVVACETINHRMGLGTDTAIKGAHLIDILLPSSWRLHLRISSYPKVLNWLDQVGRIGAGVHGLECSLVNCDLQLALLAPPKVI